MVIKLADVYHRIAFMLLAHMTADAMSTTWTSYYWVTVMINFL